MRTIYNASLPLLLASILLLGLDHQAFGSDILWEPCPPEDVGMDSRELTRMLTRVSELELDLHGLIMVRNGRVFLECYPHPYSPTDLHNVKSVSKSIMSAMVGIALEEGIIESLDETVYDYFPQYFTEDMDPRKKAITLRHLLTMTSGLELDENGPITGLIFNSDDWIAATLGRPLVEDPGTTYNYSTALSHIMSGVLTEAGGHGLLQLCEKYLFGPLGISQARWRQGPKGYYVGGAELFLTPRDLARFGMLYLNNGQWNGRSLVSKAWVVESTSGHVSIPGSNQRYGYWWYVNDEGFINAIGWGGQGISYHPETNIVSVTTSANHQTGHILFGDLDTSTISDAPHQPNPEAYNELKRTIDGLEHPEPRPVSMPSGAATGFSGRTYRLDPNPRYRSVSFDLTGGDEAMMRVGSLTGDTYDLVVGLDGLYRVTDVGDFGRMPGGSRVATRGEWIEDGTFVMDLHEMGSPTHWEIRVRFEGDRIEMSIVDRPLYREFTLSGRTR